MNLTTLLLTWSNFHVVLLQIEAIELGARLDPIFKHSYTLDITHV